ncbi:hypothetical protein FPV67DRAFT_1672318 [Lyophyllum atratum]|nr:hypothetical protein FPV67DRAFT_1672318 [Lyophyllum atratum]
MPPSRSVSSQSHRAGYDGADLTIPEYGRWAAANRPRRVRFTSEQLEFYVSKYVHYVQLAEAQDDAMRGDPAQIPAAYAQAMETLALEQQSEKSIGLCTYADIHATLDDLARKCERTPRTFEDRILLSAYALNYVLLMKDHVLRHPTRFQEDALKVIRMANERLASLDLTTRGQWEDASSDEAQWEDASPDETQWKDASSHETPQTIELIPRSLRGNLQPVTSDQLQAWLNNLPLLIGVGFMDKSSDSLYETKNGVFFVKDFWRVGGEDIFPFSPDELFEMIETADHVRVEEAP